MSRHIVSRVRSRLPAAKGLAARRGPPLARRERKTSSENEPSPERILQIAWGYAPPLILETALNFRIFDLLDEEPQTAQQLTTHTGASVRGLTAILNALVGLQFLSRKGERYSLTAESAAFLVSTRPGYHGTYFMHVTRQLIPRWLHLAEAVRSGRPVLAVNQEGIGPTFFAEFVESLFPLSYKAARALGEHLGIPKATSAINVLDIGAGSGVWGIALAHHSPLVRVTAVDWPVVLEVTKKMARRYGVGDRLAAMPGDLLEVDFGKDHHIATIGHILHSEGRERGRRLLRRVFDALAPNGTIAISEFMPNAARTGPPNALVFAVNMLVHTETGDTFTFDEISGWLKEAGFRKIRQFQAPAPSPLVLANKPG